MKKLLLLGVAAVIATLTVNAQIPAPWRADGMSIETYNIKSSTNNTTKLVCDLSVDSKGRSTPYKYVKITNNGSTASDNIITAVWQGCTNFTAGTLTNAGTLTGPCVWTMAPLEVRVWPRVNWGTNYTFNGVVTTNLIISPVADENFLPPPKLYMRNTGTTAATGDRTITVEKWW